MKLRGAPGVKEIEIFAGLTNVGAAMKLRVVFVLGSFAVGCLAVYLVSSSPPGSTVALASRPVEEGEMSSSADSAPVVSDDTAVVAASALRLTAERPSAGFDLTPVSGFVSTDEPANGKMIDEGFGVRLYFNEAENMKVNVSVEADGTKRFEEWFADFAENEGTVDSVEAVPGSIATWEVTSDDRSGSSWRHLVMETADGSYVSVSGWNVDDFEVLYEFASRIEDAPGSLEPLEPGEPGELEG